MFVVAVVLYLAGVACVVLFRRLDSLHMTIPTFFLCGRRWSNTLCFKTRVHDDEP